MDPRWDQLAQILVSYSTETRPGDKVLITMREVETFPLVRAVYARAVGIGAFPQVQFSSACLERELLRSGRPELVARVPDLEADGMRWADVYIGLRGARNPYETEGFPPSLIAVHRRAMGQVSALRTELTRWVLVRVPTESLAQQAGLSIADTEEFFFSAALRDWRKEGERYRALARIFEEADTVTIAGRDTELVFSTRGRRYVAGDGHINIPDGEIYTAPVDGSAEGQIAFELPGVYGGAFIEGIRLTFRRGRVEAAAAHTHEDLLREIVGTDAGASQIGEFGVGTNDGIPRFFGDILYDEKMGGTVHIALGRAYAACGGVNQSAVHWDLIKDLRTEGTIKLNGGTVFENGAWRIRW